MKTQANHKPAGLMLSADEMSQVSGGAMHNPPGYLMHNPPTCIMHNPPDDLTARAGMIVPPDPY